MPNYVTITGVTACDVLAVTYLNDIVGNLELLNKHDHSPSPGEGASLFSVASTVASSVERFYFFPLHRADFNGVTGTNPQLLSSSAMLGANAWGWNLTAANACGNGINVRLNLFKGRYDLKVLYLPSTCGGTACFTLGGSDIGTVDTYAASAGSSLIATISNFNVPTTSNINLFVQQGVSNTNSSGSRIELGGLTVVKVSH